MLNTTSNSQKQKYLKKEEEWATVTEKKIDEIFRLNN